MKAIFNTQNSIYNTASRLAYYRKRASECAAKGHYQPGNDWRYWKRNIWQTPSNSRGGDGRMFTDSVDQIGEMIGECHEIDRSIDNTGWFADNYQNSLIKGGVCKLRCPRGTLYIPVTWCNDWDGTVHYLNDAELVEKGEDEDAHTEAAKEAANSANYYAEQEAEEAREEDAKFQAEQDISEARETIHTVNGKALTLIREIKKAGTFTPAVCTALREKLADYLDERSRQFQIIEEREANYWSAVANY